MIDWFFILLFLYLIFYTIHGFIKLGSDRIDAAGGFILYASILVSIFGISLYLHSSQYEELLITAEKSIQEQQIIINSYEEIIKKSEGL